MSLRILTFSLLSTLLGCSSADLAPEPLDANTEFAPSPLTFAPLSEPTVPANADEVELVVTYRDPTGQVVPNVVVEFSLTSASDLAAVGASLTPSRVATDANGEARTTLLVGSSTGDLEVRARVDGETPAYLRLTVQQANTSHVTVQLAYQGQREIDSYTITALPGMDCAAALKSGLAGDTSYTFMAQDGTASFEVGAGLTAAIVGWGRDATGSKLVRGCAEFRAVPTADESKAQSGLSLPLQDLPLSLDGGLAVELEINVAHATQELATATERSVDGALMPSGTYKMFAEADYYLDAVAAELTKQGDVTGLAALRMLRETSALASSLEPALSRAGVGPKAIGEAVGELFTTRGAGITLRSHYEAGSLAPVTELTVQSVTGIKPLSFPAGTSLVLPVATLIAIFDPPTAQLLVEALQIDLALGSYGVLLLEGIEEQSTTPPVELTRAAGCSTVFGPWWSKNELAGVCDVSVALAACESARETLTERIKTDLAKLDANSPNLQLSGEVQAHDRSEDGKVDDLGPTELAGTWGAEPVNAQLRVPARTAFEK